MTRYASILGVLLPVLSACSANRSSKWVAEQTPPSAAAAAAALDVATLAERVGPSVVNITSTRDERHGLGTGFIVDPRGLIVTNAHVVEGATELVVRFADGTERPATLKGSDSALDLAVVEVRADNPLPSVTLGSSDTLRVGQSVVAVGNPFGLDHTVTTGIISAKGRAIGAGPYDDFLQTDASINPGNSGGPLFDVEGRVVGINTAINPNGQGIGFAIPVDALKGVLPQLIEKGHVTRGRLGVGIQPIDAPLAKALGLATTKGALITMVDKSGPAARAGLRVGDVILRVDDREVGNANELPRLVAHHAPGSAVSLQVKRDKSLETINAKLDTREERDKDVPIAKPAATFKGRLGAAVADADGAGALVVDIAPLSPASRAQLHAGDVIVELAGKKVDSASTLVSTLGSIAEGKTVVAKVLRGRELRFVGIELAAPVQAS